jgi:hypothetical protein
MTYAGVALYGLLRGPGGSVFIGRTGGMGGGICDSRFGDSRTGMANNFMEKATSPARRIVLI